MKASYPHPLCLNLEPVGDQDFLESRIISSKEIGPQVYLNNKVAADAIAGKPPYRQRLDPVGMSSRTLVDRISEIALRAVQAASAEVVLRWSLLALKLEVMASGTSLPKLAIAIQQIGLKYKGQWQEKVLKEVIG